MKLSYIESKIFGKICYGFIFGRTNYSKEISAFTKHRSFYNEQAEMVVRFCREHNIDYHIKNGTIT